MYLIIKCFFKMYDEIFDKSVFNELIVNFSSFPPQKKPVCTTAYTYTVY